MAHVASSELSNLVSHIDFDKVLQERINKILMVLAKKTEEYASRDNRMHNFEFAAAIMQAAGFETSREREVLSMMNKHVVSVYDLVKKTLDGKVVSPAMIDEKIGDQINYLILLEACLYAEQKCIAEYNNQKGSSGKSVS